MRSKQTCPLNHRKLWYCSSILLIILLITFFSPVINASETPPQPPTVVRVGFPQQSGLSEIGEDGSYSGYSYEYLQELAQYTGWEYEFVPFQGSNEDLQKMLGMLESGELDLVGAFNYSEELDALYDYTTTSYGSVYVTLEVLKNNSAISSSNYQSLDRIRIAVNRKANNNIAALEEFCRSNRLDTELVYCDDSKEILSALQNGEADALLSNDVGEKTDTRIVARFSPRPFYLAVTEGNYQLLNQVNSAMMMLNESDPFFTTNLYQKYFYSIEDIILLTDTEKEYLQNASVLRVGVAVDRMPHEGFDEDGNASGIAVDLLKEIGQKTGLQFEFIPMESTQQQMDDLQNNRIDISTAIVYSYDNAQKYQFSMSRPYMTAQMVMIVKEGVDPYQLEGKRLAVGPGYPYEGPYMGQVTMYNSLAECLRAIQDGEVDYSYGNSYSVQYYTTLNRYRTLNQIPLSSYIDQYCFALSHPVDPRLLTILNKSINNFSDEQLQSMVYRNSTILDTDLTMQDFVDANPLEAMLILSTAAILLIGIACCFALLQRKVGQKAKLQNTRYQLLAELSGEFLFEYDYPNDRIILTENTVQYFGGKRVQENFMKQELADHQYQENDWLLQMKDALKIHKSVVTERQFLVNGQERWLRITTAAMYGKHNRIEYTIGKITDIQQEKQEKDRLEVLAQTDSLTGLYNVASTKSRIEDCLCSDASAPGTMLIMDIDRFKNINDQFGHYTGDLILKDLANILHEVFRQEDVTGRMGGDEFVVFIKGASGNVASEKCRQLQAEILRHAIEWPLAITLSIGGAVARKGTAYDDLYLRADNALYQVKDAGRNSYRIVEPSEQMQGE